MKFFTLFLLLPVFCFSHTQILISESATKHLEPTRGLVLQTDDESKKILFQICTVKSTQGSRQSNEQYKISNCKVMGKKTGYTLLDIENRIRDLEKRDHTNLILEGSYIVVGTLLGALTGGLVAQQIATHSQPSQMYVLISYFAGGVLVGGGAGLTLTVLTKQNVSQLVSPYLFSQERNVLKHSQNLFEEEVGLVVLKSSLQKTVNDFQEVLLGIE